MAAAYTVCAARARWDGNIVRGRLMLAVLAESRSVETGEGVSGSGETADLRHAFHQRAARCAKW
jgi:aerobic-type carbon monoxide dehydrogenase small subunit (CoxS/CutS family)